MIPFADETDSLAIGDLTIENRLDRLSLYGRLDLTYDRRGLTDAKALHALLKAVIARLESGPLPETISPAESQPVPNPFA